MNTRSTSQTLPRSSNKKSQIVHIKGDTFHICPVLGCLKMFSTRKKLSNHCTDSFSGHSSGLRLLEGFVKKTNAQNCKDWRSREMVRNPSYDVGDKDMDSDAISCQPVESQMMN
jgi:hypothetical protein